MLEKTAIVSMLISFSRLRLHTYISVTASFFFRKLINFFLGNIEILLDEMLHSRVPIPSDPFLKVVVEELPHFIWDVVLELPRHVHEICFLNNLTGMNRKATFIVIHIESPFCGKSGNSFFSSPHDEPHRGITAK